MIRQGKTKLVILTNNCPALRKSEKEYYAMLAKTGVHHYSGNNIELGTACGKYYRVCLLAIIDPGDSDIRSMPEQTGHGGEAFIDSFYTQVNWNSQHFHSSFRKRFFLDFRLKFAKLQAHTQLQSKHQK
ncbi:60S ribosomal protein L30-like protein [Cricetulus griseus]|nr:60S ribosomal protein L30-like protein [Cricetulus griseus]